MADLTVLSSQAPIPAHPSFSRSTYSLYNARASTSRISLSPQKSRPTLAQLDTSPEQQDEKSEFDDADNTASPSSSTPKDSDSPTASPPPLAIVSPMPIRPNRPTHRPTRSQSAPPERTTFQPEGATRSQTHSGTLYPASASATGQFSPSLQTRSRKGSSTFNSPSSIWGYGSQNSGPADLPKPPPPLRKSLSLYHSILLHLNSFQTALRHSGVERHVQGLPPLCFHHLLISSDAPHLSLPVCLSISLCTMPAHWA